MQMFVGRISAIMNPVTYVIVNGATIALLWIGAVKVDSGILTQGAVMALVNYMSQILVELVKLANLIITVNKAIACGNRIGNVLEIEAGLTEDTAGSLEEVCRREQSESAGEACKGEQIPVVEFAHVSLTYPGAGAESLTDIHFKAMKGRQSGLSAVQVPEKRRW